MVVVARNGAGLTTGLCLLSLHFLLCTSSYTPNCNKLNWSLLDFLLLLYWSHRGSWVTIPPPQIIIPDFFPFLGKTCCLSSSFLHKSQWGWGNRFSNPGRYFYLYFSRCCVQLFQRWQCKRKLTRDQSKDWAVFLWVEVWTLLPKIERIPPATGNLKSHQRTAMGDEAS